MTLDRIARTFCVFSSISSLLVSMSTALAEPNKPLVYPQARRGDQVDTYHGVKVADPYRWLEDVDTEESRRWIEAQNRLTENFLREVPAREQIHSRLTKVYDFEKYGLPHRRGGRYFFTKNDGLQNQFVLYTMKSLDGEPRTLLDPNKMSTDGTIALSEWSVTDDGKLLAYGISDSGSDWQEWHVRDVETGKDLDDHIKWVKFSKASWTKDGKGFFYSRYDKPNEQKQLQEVNYFHKLYYHHLGTPQSADTLVYDRKDQKEWGFRGQATDDGRFLIISISHGTRRKNQIFYKDLSGPDGKVVELIKGFEAQYIFIDNDGPVFWFQTDLNAPRSRLIAVDIRKPEPEHWKEIIPEADDTLRSVSTVGNKFIATYLKDAHSQVKVFDLHGAPIRKIELPGIGSSGGFEGRRGDPETFYSFVSYANPKTIYRYDVTNGQSRVFRKPTLAFDSEAYQTKQVFYESKDGTRVPMFISHKKGLTPDGNRPTYLYGYGGFNIPLTPWFKVSQLVWMEMGGVYAVANLRGGGEYGREWHEDGMKLKKQNVFDDFIAAGEWLIDNNYTSTPKLAIAGASNGGLLVGACLVQRPDLFAAALPTVGVLDMLRFHKFTIGWAWTSDYGSPDDPEEFRALLAYSPLHNLKKGTAYPATLIATGDHDDRVFPGHSLKFAAALQAAQSGPAPTLIRIQTKAGHGAGKPTSMRIEEAADKLAFLARTLDMKVE